MIGEIMVLLRLRDWRGNNHQNNEANNCYEPSVNGCFIHFGQISEGASFFSRSSTLVFSSDSAIVVGNLEFGDGRIKVSVRSPSVVHHQWAENEQTANWASSSTAFFNDKNTLLTPDPWKMKILNFIKKGLLMICRWYTHVVIYCF